MKKIATACLILACFLCAASCTTREENAPNESALESSFSSSQSVFRESSRSESSDFSFDRNDSVQDNKEENAGQSDNVFEDENWSDRR